MLCCAVTGLCSPAGMHQCTLSRGQPPGGSSACSFWRCGCGGAAHWPASDDGRCGAGQSGAGSAISTRSSSPPRTRPTSLQAPPPSPAKWSILSGRRRSRGARWGGVALDAATGLCRCTWNADCVPISCPTPSRHQPAFTIPHPYTGGDCAAAGLPAEAGLQCAAVLPAPLFLPLQRRAAVVRRGRRWRGRTLCHGAVAGGGSLPSPTPSPNLQSFLLVALIDALSAPLPIKFAMKVLLQQGPVAGRRPRGTAAEHCQPAHCHGWARGSLRWRRDSSEASAAGSGVSCATHACHCKV